MAAGKAGELLRAIKANQQIFQVLETSKTMTDRVIDELPIVLAMIDDRQRLLKLNLSGQRLLQRDEKTSLGTQLSKLLPPSTMARLKGYFESRARDAEAGRVTFEDTLKVDGESRYFHWEICKAFGEQAGNVVHALIGNDITEARMVLEKLVEVRKDLEVASGVQSMLMPEIQTVKGSYYEMIGHCEPAQQVSGDVWWYTEVPGLGLFSIVADVTGHGIASAMVASTLIGLLVATFSRTRPSSPADIVALMAEIDSLLNQAFHRKYLVCYGAALLLEAEHRAVVLGAGWPGLARLPRVGDPETIIVSGDPLGCKSSQRRVIRDIALGPGDRLVSFSDGCYETEEGAMRSMKRWFIGVVAAQKEASLETARTNIVAERMRRTGAIPQDDATFVIIDRKER